MSDIKENSIIDEHIIFLLDSWGNLENPRISELEKKVARLEGQMAMIGGKSL